MSQKCLPLLYLNMAGEMMYILEQRLKIQPNVTEVRSSKVLQDIMAQVLKSKTLEEIFKAQELPPRRYLRILFEKLAHSSIMRLNETSMDKLFDLMLMMTKYQIQSVVMPEQVLTVTINHLNGLQQIVPKDDNLQEMIKTAHAMLLMMYGPIPVYEWNLIRSGLLTFFQDCRVKVSLMLREDRQLDDGHFILLPDRLPIELPRDAEPPGITKYYEDGEFVKTTDWPISRTYVPLENKENRNLDAAVRSTTLGVSMYKDNSTLQIKGAGGTAKAELVQYRDELKLLESLFGENLTSQAGEAEWDLSLFENSAEEKKYVKETELALKNVYKIDASKNKKSLSTAVSEMKIDSDVAKKKKPKGADMLDMLDEAAARPATAKSTRGRSFSKGSKERVPSAKRPGSVKKASK